MNTPAFILGIALIVSGIVFTLIKKGEKLRFFELTTSHLCLISGIVVALVACNVIKRTDIVPLLKSLTELQNENQSLNTQVDTSNWELGLALKNTDSLQLAIQEQQKHTEEFSKKYSEMVQRCQVVSYRAEKLENSLQASEGRIEELENSLQASEGRYEELENSLQASEGRYEVRGEATPEEIEELLKELKKKGKKREK